MSLWEVAWLTCMKNVEALGCMLSVQEDAITKSGHLDDHDIGTYENVCKAKRH
jgi:hypothetical protein